MKRTFRKFCLLLICGLILFGVYRAYQQRNNMSADSLVGELWQMLGNTADLSDDELRARILEICARYGATPTDAQVDQLFDLSRTMEKLDKEKLSQRSEEIRGKLERISDAKDTIGNLAQSVRELIDSLTDAADRIDGILNR